MHRFSGTNTSFKTEITVLVDSHDPSMYPRIVDFKKTLYLPFAPVPGITIDTVPIEMGSVMYDSDNNDFSILVNGEAWYRKVTNMSDRPFTKKDYESAAKKLNELGFIDENQKKISPISTPLKPKFTVITNDKN